MGLRLTGLSSFYLFRHALNNRSEDIYKATNQVTTNKKINAPSDDPEGATVVLGLEETLSKIESYQKNIQVGDRQLKETESSLSSVNELLQQAKALALQGANGILNQDDRNAIAAQVQQIQQQVVQIANREINGEYIFGGFRTNTAPFTLDPAQPNKTPVATYNGDTNTQTLEINENTTIPIQVRGDQTFQGSGPNTGTVDVFQTLANLQVALTTNDQSLATGVQGALKNLDSGMTQVLNQITNVGSLSNRLDSTEKSLGDQSLSLKEYKESIEGIDPDVAYSEAARSNTALQATIQSAAMVLNLPSLFSFIGK